jgi:hypothetical protein
MFTVLKKIIRLGKANSSSEPPLWDELPAEDVAYLKYRLPQIERAAGSIVRLNDHFDKAIADPSLLNDLSWKTKAFVQVAAMQGFGKPFLQAYAPLPRDMIPAEVCLRVGFGEHLALASKAFLEALDERDTVKQAAGNDAMHKAHASLVQFDAQWKEVKARYAQTRPE